MKVVIYTKSTCPFCINAKKLLDQKGVSYQDIDFLGLSDDERQDLAQKTNHYRTVPQIFIGDTFIGGFDQLSALDKAGQLDEMLTN